MQSQLSSQDMAVIKSTIREMNTGKSPYFDAISVELSRYGSNQVNNQRNEYRKITLF